MFRLISVKHQFIPDHSIPSDRLHCTVCKLNRSTSHTATHSLVIDTTCARASDSFYSIVSADYHFIALATLKANFKTCNDCTIQYGDAEVRTGISKRFAVPEYPPAAGGKNRLWPVYSYPSVPYDVSGLPVFTGFTYRFWHENGLDPRQPCLYSDVCTKWNMSY